MILGNDSDYSRPHDVDGPGQPVKERLLVRTRSGAGSLHAPAGGASARHGRFPWWSVAWRFGCALLFSILIMVVLYAYDGRDRLGTWDRRLFNMFTILFSSLVSLSLGSLLGLLGAALRWRLLARRAHQPRDVDLILGMPNPTGALKLIAHDCGPNGRWSVTTLVVLAYLLVNIIGRLAVATFGLTYDLNENAGVDYPVMLNDFGSRDWMQLDTSDLNLGQVSNFALTGLTAVPTLYNQSDPSTYNMKNISGQGLDRSVEDSIVTYTYHLREYRGLDEYSSSARVVHSSSSCIGRNFFNGAVYEKGTQVATLPEDAKDLPPNSPEFLRILHGLYDFYGPATDYLWATHWDYSQFDNPSACVTSYLHNEVYPSHVSQLIRNATVFECTTCLNDRDGEPGLGRDLLFNFPVGNLSYASGILLSFGPHDRIYQYSAGMFSAKEYGSQEHTMHFINNLNVLRYKDVGDDWYRTPVPAEYELHTAHLAARLPILAIMGAERQLPRVTRDRGASEQPFIVTSLEVKWGRAVAVLAAILAGQLLAVGVVVYASRGLLVRDHDSVLAAARLLRTAVNTVEGGSAARGKELAEGIREAAGPGGIRYGTRRVRDEEADRERLEVDLWNDVESVFPEGEDYD